MSVWPCIYLFLYLSLSIYLCLFLSISFYVSICHTCYPFIYLPFLFLSYMFAISFVRKEVPRTNYRGLVEKTSPEWLLHSFFWKLIQVGSIPSLLLLPPYLAFMTHKGYFSSFLFPLFPSIYLSIYLCEKKSSVCLCNAFFPMGKTQWEVAKTEVSWLSFPNTLPYHASSLALSWVFS